MVFLFLDPVLDAPKPASWIFTAISKCGSEKTETKRNAVGGSWEVVKFRWSALKYVD
jgi:hypothetical protein